MFSLKNKTALVTGAASGIGAAIAETFAQAGATVWIADRNEADGKAIAGRIGGKFIPLDVTSEAACTEAAQAVGALDILANVAGIGHVGTLLGTASADLDKLYAVNVRGVFNGCKAFASAMLERKSGSVINMASIGGIVAVRERLAYTTTKFAVEKLAPGDKRALNRTSAGTNAAKRSSRASMPCFIPESRSNPTAVKSFQPQTGKSCRPQS